LGIFQAFNRKTKAWVKYEKDKKGSKILDVKQKDPMKPFKGITKRGQQQ
jgi:hypothetical protein